MPEARLAWDDASSPALLKDALERREHATAGALVDALCADLDRTDRRVDATVAKRVLAALRQHLRFAQLKRVAAKLDEHAQDDVQVLRQLAQARIELGEITRAIEGLLELEERIGEELEIAPGSVAHRAALEDELGETLGLLGRSYKQLYVDAQPGPSEPREYDLGRSLEYYGQAYHARLGDYLWHGINSVALLTRKHRVAKRRPNAISNEAAKRAREILDEIDRKSPPMPWDLANRIEACLAIGDTPGAIVATTAYLDAADPFQVRSTRRQLVEVWGLSEDRPPGDHILPLMNARFAELGGTPDIVELHPSQAPVYEKVWGKTGYKSLRWLAEALGRAKSVARIGPNKYDGDGTGFLFDGAWISAAYAGRHLLLTNAHVCSNDEAVLGQYPFPSRPEELTATFLGAGGASEAEELAFGELLFTSAPSELDATLVELERVPEGCQPPPITGRSPPVTTKGDARLNILGHPKGLDLRISLQDNTVVDVGERYVRYRTPTDPGSSGSPVFNQKWELVALHHAASATVGANEGIRIDVIVDAIRKDLT